MPIPIIVWGTVIVISAVVGIIKTGSAIRRTNKVKERYAKRRGVYEAFIGVFEDKHKYVSA